eukprot:3110692-Rhodomonas_salina.1
MNQCQNRHHLIGIVTSIAENRNRALDYPFQYFDHHRKLIMTTRAPVHFAFGLLGTAAMAWKYRGISSFDRALTSASKPSTCPHPLITIDHDYPAEIKRVFVLGLFGVTVHVRLELAPTLWLIASRASPNEASAAAWRECSLASM